MIKKRTSWNKGKTYRINATILKCRVCKKEIYITLYRVKKGEGKFCSRKCASSGKFNPMFGKHLSNKTKNKISAFFKGRKQTPEHIKKRIRCYRENHWRWNGGIVASGEGYIYIKNRNHPFCNSEGYVLRSHLVIEKLIGRYLKPKEVVHHKGIKYPLGSIKNKQDDRKENLRLFKNNSEHFKIEHCHRTKKLG